MPRITDITGKDQEEQTTKLMHAVNTPGVRNKMETSTPLDQGDIDRFRSAFIDATNTLLPRTSFHKYAEDEIQSGRCFASDAMTANVNHFHYSIDPQSDHILLPDTSSYTIQNRKKIADRTWYTKEERLHAATVCAACPMIPLAHIGLLSMAHEALMNKYDSIKCAVPDGDFISYLMRWIPTNTTGEVVPAVSIALLRSLQLQGNNPEQRTEYLAKILERVHDRQFTDPEAMKEVWKNAKQFLISGRFFYKQFSGHSEHPVEVTCPGKQFMRDHWELHHKLYTAATERQQEPIVSSLLSTLGAQFQTARTT